MSEELSKEEKFVKQYGSSFQNTKNVEANNNLNFLIHGPADAGKTTLATTLDGNVLMASCEGGVTSILGEDLSFQEINSMKDLKRFYKYCEIKQEDIDWVVLDSITEIAQLCLDEQKKEVKDNRQAYGNLYEELRRLLRTFRGLECNVYFTAKQSRERVNGRTLFTASLPGKKFTKEEPVSHDFDFVFAAHIDEGEEPKDGEEHDRYLQCLRGDGYDVRSRESTYLSFREEMDLEKIREKILKGFNESRVSEE